MSLSKIFDLGADTLSLGQGDQDVNIVSKNGTNIKINGIIPSAGGGSGVPPVGDIDFIGNLNCNDVVGGGTKGIITAEKKLVSGIGGIETTGNIDIKANANLTIEGNGNIDQQGNGKITSGTAGIESRGDIITLGAHDLVIGKDIYFDGIDIYHRTFNPEEQKSYKDYKELAGLNDNNKFTGSNQFNSNTTEFAAKVSVGTRDPVSLLFTQNLALNTSGNIESKTINNGTSVQCGNINCGNAGLNEVRARVFNTRTNEHNLPDGWLIEQGLPNSPAQPLDKVLQIKAQEAGALVSITPSDFIGTNPAIILDPNTTAGGGKIFAANFTLGSTVDRYRLTQDITGGLSDTLQISAPTANSKVEFRDNSNNVILNVNKTVVELGTNIPLKFDNYEFRPVQYYKDITAFSFNNAAIGPTNLIFTTNDTNWVNKNTGAVNQSLNMAVDANKGSYKLAFQQTSAGTLGEINDMRIISDIVLTLVNDADPQISLPSPVAYCFQAYDGGSVGGVNNLSPIITMTPGSFVYNVYAQFPGVTGNETSNVRITLTKMNYFA
jgi:signal peptidase I